MENKYEEGIWPNDQSPEGYDPYCDLSFVLDVPSLREMFDIAKAGDTNAVS